ncbi:DUF695 domain-containing protein [Sphingobacterium sp. lm-10]|uniref:DUF695 domain-containing protein n=1 Tax=Sphingobacterium sp. lm-10 TaxID=2944904 RepID=UPI00201FD820|nr:DUF695 domain-containing protein [Sphingobacterium sp. lm-10]MCL7986810.1 DUF695 domain-containing protein [Sphingobacterium sp. lm-10]
MKLFKKLVMKQDGREVLIGPQEISEFWEWFVKHEERFFKAVKDGNVEKGFFKSLAPRLSKLHSGIYFLTGLYGNKAELVFTPDGNIKNIVFAEDIVSMAPDLPNWIFTALKPPTSIEHASIQVGDFVFTKDNLHFYANEDAIYPDEIDLSIVYDGYVESADEIITNGIYIFLDNYLGELQSITLIDSVTVIGQPAADQDLIPITRLQDFLTWRKKEFIEEYESNYNVPNADSFSVYKGEISSGQPLVAYMNTHLLEWENKPSRPYIIRVSLEYQSTHADGIPDDDILIALTSVEEILSEILKDETQYLYVGQQTGDGVREIYFVSKEFRVCSKLIYESLSAYSGELTYSYDIYKDKYWQTFERYRKHHNL